MKHSVTEVVLQNGARGLLIHIPESTVMTYEFNFRAGEYLVQKKKWETPHIMEHVLLGANELIPKARHFQAEFEKNGAYCNASTGTYDITYEAECADFEWDRILDLMMVAITKPLFLQDEFDAEFGNVREELTARSNNHFRHLSLALREAYGFSVLTDQTRLQLMQNVMLEDIRAHYKKTHKVDNMRFVIAGKLPPERRKLIRQLLETTELPKGEGRLALPHEMPIKLNKPLYLHNETIDNLYFYIDTFISRRMRDPETDALSLINTMLTETLYSRILGTARERGLVYHVSSGFGQTIDSSNWWFGAQVMPKNAPKLFEIIIHELNAVFKGELDDDDITAAKQYALGRYQRSGQTVAGTAAGYSHRYFFDDGIDDYYKVPERIRAVSKNRIVTITKAMFEEKIWGMGALGQAGEPFVEKLHQQLASLWD
jgi:predicted Zn-dependent peptidase